MNNILFELPDRDYREAEGVSHSALKHIAVSPLHYKYHRETPQEQTPAMLIGTLFHLALFEPNKFREGVSHAVKPEGMSFATKDGKAWRDIQKAPIISADDNAAINGMVASMRANVAAAAYLANGKAEVSLFAQDEKTGLQLKGRCDWLWRDRPVMLDGKTCESAADFEREGAARRYFQQAAYYIDLASENDVQIEAFVFLVAEKQPPYGVRLVEYDEAGINAGREIYRKELDTLGRCIERNEWPGYRSDVETIALPAWAMKQLEQVV